MARRRGVQAGRRWVHGQGVGRVRSVAVGLGRVSARTETGRTSRRVRWVADLRLDRDGRSAGGVRGSGSVDLDVWIGDEQGLQPATDARFELLSLQRRWEFTTVRPWQTENRTRRATFARRQSIDARRRWRGTRASSALGRAAIEYTGTPAHADQTRSWRGRTTPHGTGARTSNRGRATV